MAPEFEEPEFSAFELENAWSSEVPFINLDAAEMSYYFSALEDDLVREVSISLQHQKFILFHLDDPLEYLKSFATYTWYEESDEAAEEFIQWYVDRFRTELEEQREREWSREVESDLEYWIKYVANDERETIIVYDLDARETLFVRYGDKHSVTMQELHQKLAEGRNIFVIHNHPNHTGASLADLSAVAWLDAEYFVVVNPDGTLHFHKRIGDAMVALEPVHNPDIVAPFDPFETAVAELAYLFQTWSEEGNPPEMVMRQGEAAPRALDYVRDPQGKRTDEPEFDKDFARYNPLLSPIPKADFYTLLPTALLYSEVLKAARFAGSHGLDMAGMLLVHFLEGSGEKYDLLPVDDMIDELPLLRKDILDLIGYNLGDFFPPSDDPESKLIRRKLRESATHAVYSYAGEWREVGMGKNADANVYNFEAIPFDRDLSQLGKLLYGQPPSEDISQAEYDWYNAVGDFYYYPRVAVVVDKITGNAEVSLVIEVRDQYDWHADAGPLDNIMASLETVGLGQHFAVSGRSSPIVGRFNLGDKVSVEDSSGKTRYYYELKDIDWNADE